jgi:hypothetical protein
LIWRGHTAVSMVKQKDMQQQQQAIKNARTRSECEDVVHMSSSHSDSLPGPPALFSPRA